MKKPVFTGAGVAIITPFKSTGEVNYEEFGRIIDHQIAHHTDAIIVCGTTGEASALHDKEHREVLAWCCEYVNHRVPVIAGTGSNHTDYAIALTKFAAECGADAGLSVTPYYNKTTQRGLIAHYNAIADCSDLPIILYNVPGRTGVNMTAATTIRIAGDFPNVIGIKEASGKIDQIQEILDWRSRDFLVLSGDDALTLDLMSRGADGVISVAVNAFPRKMMTCIDLAKKGDFEGARKAYECLEEAVTALFAEGNPTGVKCAMSVLGLIGNTLRLPLVPGTPQLEARFKELIAKYDLN